jgi:hypothetical protein
MFHFAFCQDSIFSLLSLVQDFLSTKNLWWIVSIQ